jgi:hypothetical protein
MQLVKTIPKIGPYPELQTFRCQQCRTLRQLTSSFIGFVLARSEFYSAVN